MAETIVDSYSESYRDDGFAAYEDRGAGQSFTGNGKRLTSCKLFIKNTNAQTGNIQARIYAHSGTYGTNSVPTGVALAVSDNYDVENIGSAYALHSFTFSGDDKITLTDETHYVLTLEWPGGQFIVIGTAWGTATHSGNLSQCTAAKDWSSGAADVPFYVYGESLEEESSETFACLTTLEEESSETFGLSTILKEIETTVLVSPEDSTKQEGPITFIWEIPIDAEDKNVHAHIQIDKTSDSFEDLEVDAHSMQGGFEYYDGESWVEYPQDGVASAYYGNQARYIANLTLGSKWWRVRGGAE